MPNRNSAAQICCSCLGLLAAAAPLQAQTAPPAITADEKGLGVKSADSQLSYRLRGLLQVDSRWYIDDRELDDRDTFFLRRARPILVGTVLGMVDMRLVPDFAEGRAQIFDARTWVCSCPAMCWPA